MFIQLIHTNSQQISLCPIFCWFLTDPQGNPRYIPFSFTPWKFSKRFYPHCIWWSPTQSPSHTYIYIYIYLYIYIQIYTVYNCYHRLLLPYPMLYSIRIPHRLSPSQPLFHSQRLCPQTNPIPKWPGGLEPLDMFTPIKPLYMSICKYIYMCVCICVCIYIYVCVCVFIHLFVSVYVYIWICVYIYIYMYICIYLYMYICIYLYMYICICVYM